MLKFIHRLGAKIKPIYQKGKIKAADNYHLLFKSAADNHFRLQRCREDAKTGKVTCDLVFDSYVSLKKYQKRLRRVTLSLSSVISLIIISTLAIQLILPVFKSNAAVNLFAQSSWDGGAIITEGECTTAGGTWDVSNSICVATHTNNKTNWDGYAAADSGIEASVAGQMTLATNTETDTHTSQADFEKGITNQTSTTQTADSVELEISAPAATSTIQTDDSTNESGFNKIDSDFYSDATAVVNTGDNAHVQIKDPIDWVDGVFNNNCSLLSSGGTIVNDGGINVKEFYFTSFDLTTSCTPTGSYPLKIYVQGDVNISSQINIRATIQNAKLGGKNGGSQNQDGQGYYNGYGSSMGGGGAYGGNGGDSVYGNNGGSAYGNNSIDVLYGGSGGGGGYDSAHFGGGGGGAINIKSSGMITINGGGTIDARGSAAYRSGGSTYNRAGGGAGGAVKLEAPVVNISGGNIYAGGGNGGNYGGGGGGGGRVFIGRNSGSNGNINRSGGLGGTSTNPAGGNGTVGSYLLSSFTPFLLFPATANYSSYIDSTHTNGVAWKNFTWTKGETGDTTDTSISFRIKTSADGDKNMPADIDSAGCLVAADSINGERTFDLTSCGDEINDNHRYLWYKATLNSNSPDLDKTPKLEDVKTTWVNKYYSSGNHISSTINTGQKTKDGGVSLSWDETLPAGVGADAIKMQVASSNESYSDNFDDGASNWSQSNVATGGTAEITELDDKIYFDVSSDGTGGSGFNYSKIIKDNPSELEGDFDIQIDYELPNGQIETPTLYNVYGRFIVNFGSDNVYLERRADSNGTNNYYGVVKVDGTNYPSPLIPTTDTSGKLRIKREGVTVSMYYWDSSNGWTLLISKDYGSVIAATQINFTTYVNRESTENIRTAFDNFIVWGNNNGNTNGEFFGPDGTTGTYYTTNTGQTLSSVHNGSQYFKYKTYFNTDDNTVTPQLNSATLNYDYYGNKGLVALYHLNGTGSASNGDIVYDATRNGNNGTVSDANTSGLAYIDQTGDLDGLGESMSFDGVDDYVDTNLNVDNSSSFSIETWVNTDTLSMAEWEKSIVHDRDGGSWPSFDVYLGNDSKFHLRVFSDSDTFWVSADTPTISEGTWYHVVAVYDSDNDYAKIYLNAEGSNELDTSSGVFSNAERMLKIGHGITSNRFFDGQIDEVAIYDRALSQEEIESHYNAGAPSHINSGNQSAHILSSVYDSTDSANVISGIQVDGDVPTNAILKVQLRSSSDNSTWTAWCGPDVCDNSDYFNITSSDLGSVKPFVGNTDLSTGNNDRYLQYKLSLGSDGNVTPQIDDFSVQYVVNNPPVIAITTGTVTQNTQSGTVDLNYNITNGGVGDEAEPSDSFESMLFFTTDNGSGLTLTSDITASSSSIDITGEDGSKIPTSGYIQINNEVIKYESKSGSGSNWTLDTLTRGTWPTNETTSRTSQAAAHSTGAVVWIKADENQITTTSPVNGVGIGLLVDANSDTLQGDAVDQNYTIQWSPKDDAFLGDLYESQLKLQVVAHDNNPANQIGSGASTSFAIDTIAPTADNAAATYESIKVDGREGIDGNDIDDEIVLTLEATDSGSAKLEYRYDIEKDLECSVDNDLSGESWTQLNTSDTDDLEAGTFTKIVQLDSGNFDETLEYDKRKQTAICVQYRDEFQNTNSTAYEVELPERPTAMMIQDITNTRTTPNELGLFVSWKTSGMTPGSDQGEFQSYVIERKEGTEGSFNQVAEITDKAENYYRDNDLGTDTTVSYFYRVYVKDGIDNVSYYSATDDSDNAVLHGIPNGVQDAGEGGGGESTDTPTINESSVSITANTNWAKITWDTGATELSDSTVYYTNDGGAANTNDDLVTVSSMKTQGDQEHAVILTGLTPGETYSVLLRSENINENADTYLTSFDTLSGPTISAVKVTDYRSQVATIEWDTDTDSNTYVYYSTTKSALNSGSVSAEGVDNSVSEHEHATETSLIPNTAYYYYVKSGNTEDRNPNVDTGEFDYYEIDTSYTFASTDDVSNPQLDVSTDESSEIVESTTKNSATLSFSANENVTAIVEYSNTQSDFDSGDQKEESSSTSLQTSHTVNLENLEQGDTYYFKIKLKDQAGNEGVYPSSGYFEFDTVAGPDLSSITCTEGENQITISWTSDQPASTSVTYGTDNDLGNYTYRAEESGNSTAHSVDIDGLLPLTVYYYKVSSQNVAGGATSSDISNCTTLGEDVDTTGPNITKVKEVFVDKNQCLVYWETDEPATSQVRYSTTDGVYSSLTAEDTNRVTVHKELVTGLNADTTYYYKVISKDASGNEDDADGYSFETLANDLGEDAIKNAIEEAYDVPNISSSSASVSDSDDNSATITWTTDKQSNSIVAYKTEGGSYNEQGSSREYVTNHEVIIKNLSPNTKYYYYVRSADQLGISSQSDVGSFTTGSQSTIFNVEAVDIDYNEATISWETSLNTTSQIEYGIKSSDLDKETDESSNETKSHAAQLTNLEPGTKYYYRIKGNDSSNNLYSSSQYTFTTPAPPEIQDFKLDSISEHKIKVSFNTSIETDAFVTLTPQNTEETKEVSTGNPDLRLDHSLEISDLESGTTYSLVVKVRDSDGNITEQTIDNYTTDKDENPPKIDNIRTGSALTQNDKVQVIISYTTDEPATTGMLWREGLKGAEKELKVDSELTKKHTIVVTTFKPGTAYYFKTKSTDKAGNTQIAKDFAILTPKRSENIIQIIVKNFQDIFSWTGSIGK